MNTTQPNVHQHNLSNRTINQLLCQVKFLKSLLVLNSVNSGLVQPHPNELSYHVKRTKKYLKYNSVDLHGSHILPHFDDNNADPSLDIDNMASYDSENED